MKILVGDILQSGAQTLVNTVNCVGIMGKGIALEFKNKFPDMFKDYEDKCKRREVKLGEPYIYITLFFPQIVNFPTKDHWKSVSKYNDIEAGLKHLLAHYKEWGIQSLAIPPLGCGNGQLDWKAVGPLIYRYVKQMAIPVEMYAPYGTPAKELTVEYLSNTTAKEGSENRWTTQSAINQSWIALVEILRRIEEQPYHWPVGRTIFQKIAYIATQQGLPTGFVYHESSYGPFSKEQKGAITKLVNNGLIQEERLGRMFRVKVGPNYIRIKKDYEPELSKWKTIIEKTMDLFMRMNTDQSEIVATVIFAADSIKKKDSIVPTETQVLDAVMKWKQKRRPPLDQAVVASTIRNLAILRWLNVKPDSALPISEEESFAF